jgi:DNA repair protein RadC
MNFPEWTRVAEVELVYKTKEKPSEIPKITTSKDIYNILRQVWDENKIDMLEEFKVIFLNRANRVTGVYDASSGGEIYLLLQMLRPFLFPSFFR